MACNMHFVRSIVVGVRRGAWLGLFGDVAARTHETFKTGVEARRSLLFIILLKKEKY